MKGNRKFAIALIVISMAFALALMDKLSGGEFVTVAVTVVTGFVGGNMVEHWKKAPA